jgi:hypothetical protein
MGNTIVIEIKNEKARNLIRDLEEMDIIKVIKENFPLKINVSQKFKGFLTKKQGESLNNHIKTSREKWDNI